MMCGSPLPLVPEAFAQAHLRLLYPIPTPHSWAFAEAEKLLGMRLG